MIPLYSAYDQCTCIKVCGVKGFFVEGEQYFDPVYTDRKRPPQATFD